MFLTKKKGKQELSDTAILCSGKELGDMMSFWMLRRVMGRSQKQASFPFTSEHRSYPGEDEVEAGNGKKAHLAQGGENAFSWIPF